MIPLVIHCLQFLDLKFLNRIDEVVKFNPLSIDELQKNNNFTNRRVLKKPAT